MARILAPWIVAAVRANDGWDPATEDLVARCQRRLGERVEVDADLLIERGRPALAARLLAYEAHCVQFWTDPLGPIVTVHRPLAVVAQSDRRGERRDLVEELAHLRELPDVGPYVHELLRAAPDPARLARLGEACDAALTRDGSSGVARVVTESPVVALAGLGGAASPGEVSRHFTLHVNWRPWRDRDVRRLVRVESTAEEVWPDPAAVLAPLSDG